MSLVFVPLYIKFLGIESWGVIGIFTTLQAVMVIFDMGLSAAMTRELSRLSVLPDKEQEMRNLVKSMEIIYWGIAVLIGIVIISISHFIAFTWINPGQLSPQTIQNALLIMGFAMALQWPASLYSGGLIGLQKQVLLNEINIVSSTLRGGGAVLLLWLVSPTIQAFFVWQIAVSSLNTIILYKFLWRSIPATDKSAIFQKQLLIGIWRFAAGMGGISILALILTQIDKIILSRVLSLESFGYYTFASMVAMSLARLFTPVFYSIYPKLTQLAAGNNEDSLKQFYHKSSQFMAVLIIPVALVVALFSHEIILLWTQNALTADKTHLLVSILICGTAINGLMNPPYALQLAFGWTKLNFFTNLIAVILMIPLIYYLAIQFGATGAAIAWLILNIGYILFLIPVMHHRLLKSEKWRWYWHDVGVPLLVGLTVVSIGRFLLNDGSSQLVIVLSLTIISGLTLMVTLLSLPVIRSLAISQLSRVKLLNRN